MIKFCRDCKHSKSERNNDYRLECHHPVVVSHDEYTLASVQSRGTSCNVEREKGWFKPCGQKGKLWEQK